nr:hypothetical protein [Deltaproteobacteria bacterium]
ISDAGRIVRMRAEEVRVIHRSTQGVRLIDLDENEKLVGVARAEREDEKENGNGAEPEEVGSEGPLEEPLPEEPEEEGKDGGAEEE